ncbi:MAG: LysM peptidoglycan-binding domain-containing protein [Roseateles sp.]|nr:MAG: LysM peptidoglycan-binding domain-containing protein [Roseateles sp.]
MRLHGLVGLLGGLCLAAAALAQPAAATDDWRYRVQPGDTLVSLSEDWLDGRYGWRDLQKLNRVADPLRLMPGSTLRLPLAWLRREAGVAEVVFVKGEVLRLRGTASQPLVLGDTLQSGDRLRSAAQSSASLRFADGSRLLLPPLSEVALQQLLVLGRGALPVVQLGLTRGGAEQRVAPNAQRVPLYEVRTPQVNLGVRGTEFRVRAEGQVAHLEVLSGAVHADGVTPDISAGQGLRAEGAQRQRAPLLAAPDLSGLPTRVEQLPLVVSWPAGPVGAQAWRAQLFAAGDPQALLLDSRVDQPLLRWPEARDLPDGDYLLRLRAIDELGLEGQAAERPLRLEARPEPPFITRPEAGAVSYSGAITLGWTLNTAAPRVRLQIARDEAFRDLALQPPPLTAAEFEARAADLGGDGRYHWRVAAVQADGRAGPFGEAQRFELRPPPPSPPPAEPEQAGDQLLLRWRADAGVVRYELEWADTPGFDGPTLQRFSTDQAQLALPRPAPGSYYLRARGFNADGAPSAWGQTQRIEQPYPRWLWLLPLLLVPLL